MKGKKTYDYDAYDNYNYDYDAYDYAEKYQSTTVQAKASKNTTSATKTSPSKNDPKSGQKAVTTKEVTKVESAKDKPKDKLNSVTNGMTLVKASSNDSQKSLGLGLKVQSSEKKEVAIPRGLNEKYPKINYGIDENVNEKPNINLVIIGHVDAGKSTLMGHILYKLGIVTEKAMRKNETEAKQIGKATFELAWAMDEDASERFRGVTMDVAYKNFETSSKLVNIMDAPGHKDFIPNMISGTAAADCAILVIDSTKGGFNAGFFDGGQTKEHSILARSLGVSQIIVAINKLDTQDWSQERYEYIRNMVEDYLGTLQFDMKKVRSIPVSGLRGINLTTKPTDVTQLGWYDGPTLLEMIDSFENPIRNLETPSRLAISDIGQGKVEFLQGFSVFGKVEGGIFFEGKDYIIMPGNIRVKVKAIGVDNKKSNSISVGQTGELLLIVDEIKQKEIESGCIMCALEFPISIVTEFKAQILTLDLKLPITIGEKVELHMQSKKIQASVIKIDKIFNKAGEVIKSNSRLVPMNTNALVTIRTDEKICAELFSNIKNLGRVTFREAGKTIAAGIIVELLK